MIQAILIAVALLGLDVLSGVVIAISKGVFTPQKLPQFLYTSIDWRFYIGVLVTGIAQSALSGNITDSRVLAAAFITELGTISLKLAQDVISKWAGTAPVTATLK